MFCNKLVSWILIFFLLVLITIQYKAKCAHDFTESINYQSVDDKQWNPAQIANKKKSQRSLTFCLMQSRMACGKKLILQSLLFHFIVWALAVYKAAFSINIWILFSFLWRCLWLSKKNHKHKQFCLWSLKKGLSLQRKWGDNNKWPKDLWFVSVTFMSLALQMFLQSSCWSSASTHACPYTCQ